MECYGFLKEIYFSYHFVCVCVCTCSAHGGQKRKDLRSIRFEVAGELPDMGTGSSG